jgi:hypothetical protein
VFTQSADPQLGPLQDNGGPTFTRAVTPSSPAYGAGNPGVSGLPSTDQRGLPRVVHNRLDLGAFEVQGAMPPRLPPPPGLPPSPGNFVTTTTLLSIQTSFGLFGLQGGETETLTAHVLDAHGHPVPHGQVTFTDLDKSQTVGVMNGTATASFTFGPFDLNPFQGSHPVSAVYSDQGGSFIGSAASGNVVVPPFARLELCALDFFEFFSFA